MKRRINLSLALISLIAILGVTGGISAVFYGVFIRQVFADLKQSALILSDSGLFTDPEGSLSGQRPISGQIRISWIDEGGTVLYDNQAPWEGLDNHLDRPEVRETLSFGEGKSRRHSGTMDSDSFYYALLLENGTVLRLCVEAKSVSGLILTALPVLAILAVLVLLLCLLSGHLLTRGLLEPIREMAGDLDAGYKGAVYRELEPFAERIRLQHEKILEAAKSRQDFTASVSHELKTPITAISGYAELIENQLADRESEIYIAGQIRHNADRLLCLISDIIRLSELDHPELERRFETVDLYALLSESARDFQGLARRFKVRLDIRGEQAFLYGDPALIREMIDNLLQNAISYNQEGGEVLAEAGYEGGHAVLTVTDTGIGIAKDQQEKIFERFYRVDKSRSRVSGGTGLGLAIVRHIAELHGAVIGLDSALGEGTRICVRF